MAPRKDQMKRVAGLALVILLSSIFSSCNKEVKVPDDEFYEEWRTLAETSQPSSPSEGDTGVDLPEKVRQQEQEIVEPEPPPKELPTNKISIAMRDTDVNVILRALARIANQNIMMNAEVRGVTNINVEDAPWDQVFLGILRTRGLTYSWEGDILRVMTLADMKHDSAIEKALQVKKIQSIERIKVEPLLTRVIPVNYADAEELKEDLDNILTRMGDRETGKEHPKGSITVNKHNNALIIEAIRDDIEKIVNLIDELDRPIPQVTIDAKIVETTRKTARELGVQWGGLYHGTSGGDNYWITPGANSNEAGAPPPSAGTGGNFPAQFLQGQDSEGGSSSGLTLGFMAVNAGEYVLDVQLSALEEANKLNILSSPTLTTVDNKMAFVEAGERIPYQTVDDDDINIEWQDATLRLEVTPHVIDDKTIKLDIVIHKDEVDFSRTVLGNPTIITRKEETTLIINDGQTTVIGGISKETDLGASEGVPYLKDLPWLGNLFKNDLKDARLQEMLIFITPRILKEKVADQQ